MSPLKQKTFVIDADQMVKLNEWFNKKQPLYEGAIGGRYEYSFCPTSIGVIIKVRDTMHGDEIDLSDYLSW